MAKYTILNPKKGTKKSNIDGHNHRLMGLEGLLLYESLFESRSVITGSPEFPNILSYLQIQC